MKFKEFMRNNKTPALEIHQATKANSLPSPVKTYPKVWSKVYYKEYPRFPHILLPIQKNVKKADIFSTLINRKSADNPPKGVVDLDRISKIMFFSAGISRIEKKSSLAKRTYPSGGARYPLEIYPIILRDSTEIPAGIYHYNVKHHALELLQKGKFSNKLRKIGGEINKKVLSESFMVIAISGVFSRSEIKYGIRGYRFMLLEAGHLGQNFYLVSSALLLGCRAIGGFIDDLLNELLELDVEKEQSIYLLAIGVE